MRRSTGLFIAAAVCIPTSFVLLLMGLTLKGLTVVYISIGVSACALPIAVVAIVVRVREDMRRRRAIPPPGIWMVPVNDGIASVSPPDLPLA